MKFNQRWANFRRTAVGRIIDLIAESLTEPRYALQLFADLPRLFLRHIVLGRFLILVYRESGIGDIVCTFACLASLRERMPDVLIA
jgi:hypothetical protein